MRVNTFFPPGTKEIDIAATLEHLRDQRPQMVKTKVCIFCITLLCYCYIHVFH
jgi:hypothetical protein